MTMMAAKEEHDRRQPSREEEGHGQGVDIFTSQFCNLMPHEEKVVVVTCVPRAVVTGERCLRFGYVDRFDPV